jgi:hypothetical protein
MNTNNADKKNSRTCRQINELREFQSETKEVIKRKRDK